MSLNQSTSSAPANMKNVGARQHAHLPRRVEIEEVPDEGDIPVASSSLPSSRAPSPSSTSSSSDVPPAPEVKTHSVELPTALLGASGARSFTTPAPGWPRAFPLELLSLTGLSASNPVLNHRQTPVTPTRNSTTYHIPSSDDPGVNASSPIPSRTRAERIAGRKHKMIKGRWKEKEARDEQREQQRRETAQQRKEADAREAQEAKQAARLKKQDAINNVLAYMKAQEITYGDLLEYLSDAKASSGTGRTRHDGLFAVQGRVERILDNWVSSKNSDTGRHAVRDWIKKFVSKEVNAEGNKVTRSGLLLSARRIVDASFALDFDLRGLYAQLRELCPWATDLLTHFGTTTRQRKKLSVIDRGAEIPAKILRFLDRHEKDADNTLLPSDPSSDPDYLPPSDPESSVYDSDSEDSHVADEETSDSDFSESDSDSSSSSDSESELDLAQPDNDKDDNATREASHPVPGLQERGARHSRPGLLQQLSDSSRMNLRRRAQAPLDDSPLGNVYDNINFMFRAAEQIMGKKDSQENGTCATAFTLYDAPCEKMRTADLVDSFQNAPPLAFKDIRLSQEENTSLREQLIWTVMNVVVQHGGESFSKYKADVASHSPESHGIPVHKTEVFPMPAMNIDESSTVGNAQVLMAATHGLLETYWGDVAHDPGSLHFNNIRLDRKPIVLSSLPPYRVCRDLIFVSLYARVLLCLEHVSEVSIDKYASKYTYEDLYRHAAAIVDRYADAEVAQKARPSDNVFSNAVLFLRDALLLRHFADAIKAGHSDHMVTVLKLWALGFRAMGRTKYAHELLHLIHNIVHVWPPALRNVIMKNWLVNTTGKPEGFIPVDLLQEHLNFWIKVVYQAHGANASWEWLATIAPCINTLRQLASQMHAELGSHQGSKHAAPDLSKDIATLMASLREHTVYVQERARKFNDQVAPVPNVYTAGIHNLAGALSDYNDLFAKMKARRAKVPLLGKSVLATYGVGLPPAADTHSPPTSRPASPVDDDVDMMEEASDEDENPESDGEGMESEASEAEEDRVDVSRDEFFSLERAEDVALDMDGY
ncbi:hypothetical protein C8T65DRAFT_741054 [Cerioporus squamosus]|nr:hypothetical protein C8T65DRAFT_741054 [Cerioporus squamosus]